MQFQIRIYLFPWFHWFPLCFAYDPVNIDQIFHSIVLLPSFFSFLLPSKIESHEIGGRPPVEFLKKKSKIQFSNCRIFAVYTAITQANEEMKEAKEAKAKWDHRSRFGATLTFDV